MPRYTAAYRSFKLRLDEVEVLRRSAALKERNDPVRYRNEINAACRGSIVLLSSHVEAFVKELGEIAIDSFFHKNVPRSKFPLKLFYHISKDIIDEIHNTNEPEKISEKIFAFIDSDLPFWSRAGQLPSQIPIERFNKGFSNPAFDKVRAYFSRFGYNFYRRDLQRLLKADSAVVINMLNHLVDTRNNIAHGDPTATKTPQEIRDMIDLISSYCRATDDVFARWCRSEFCSIRT